jgi:hypothetical protein
VIIKVKLTDYGPDDNTYLTPELTDFLSILSSNIVILLFSIQKHSLPSQSIPLSINLYTVSINILTHTQMEG